MTHAWFDAGNGRKVYRRIPERRPDNRSDLACPMLVRDFDEPVQSCADGKWYTSKAALARSAKAAHNPHGIDFIELGNEQMPWVEYQTSETKLRDDIREAAQDVKEGRLPDVLMLED